MRGLSRLTAMLALAVALVVVESGCKRENKPAPAVVEQQTGAPVLVSTIHVADPRSKPQLVRGFHDVEADAWRWTMQKFSVVLRTPAGATQKGATLDFKFAIPAVSIARLKSLTLRGTVNGFALPPETYMQAGQFTYSQDVPPAALAGAAVTVDFALDKAMPPSSQDARQLGVIAQTVGLEPK